MKREYITAISIDRGVIQLIDPDWNVAYYTQRGIREYSKAQINVLISRGKLHPNWANIPELPKNWSISYEEPSIMGRAYATFNPNRKEKLF